MMGKTVPLEFDIFARDKSGPVFDKFGNRVRTAGNDVGFLTQQSKNLIAAAAGYVVFDKAADFVRGSIEEGRESVKVNAQSEAAILSTGSAANITAKQIGDLSESISLKIGVDDEAIQSGANLLLTFKNVRNEVGSGNQVFNRATVAANDLAAAGFGSIESSSKMLGKALNDPLLGITALGRAGVTFTAQQKEQIKALVETGDLLTAQKMILKEVESQVGGSAEAQADSLDKLTVAWDNIKEEVGTALLPVLYDFSDYVTKEGVPAGERFASWLRDDGIPAAKEFGAEAKAMGQELAPLAQSILPALASVLDTTADAAVALAPAVKAIVDAFLALPPGVQSAIIVGGAATRFGGGLNLLAPMGGGGGKGSKGGGGAPSVIGTPGGALAAAGAWYATTSVADLIDTSRRNLTGGADPSSLSSTLDRQGKTTAATIAAIRKSFESSNIGKYADDLSIDLDKLAESYAKNGRQGEYVKEVMDDLDSRYSKTKDILGDAFGFAGLNTESDKIGEVKSAINDLDESMNTARFTTQTMATGQNELAGLLGFTEDAAGGLQLSLDTLGGTHPAPTITLPGGAEASQLSSGLLRTLDQVVGQKNISLSLFGYENAMSKIESLRSGLASLPGGQTVVPLLDFATGGLGKPKKKADGGPITGPGGPRDDIIPILGSNGENMWSAADVDAAGGQSNVERIKAAVRGGVRMADGGPVGSVPIGVAMGGGPIDLSDRSLASLATLLAIPLERALAANLRTASAIADGTVDAYQQRVDAKRVERGVEF